MTTLAGKIRRGRNGLSKRLARLLMPALVKPVRHALTLESLGTGDGAWMVPTNLINERSICYCVGVGVNATFDFALTQRFQCHVHSFDPTPRAIEYMRNQDRGAGRLTFHPIGLWREEAELRFFAPQNAHHVNHSVVDLHGTNDFFVAKCLRLSTIMKSLGHAHVDLLKLDIEGSWAAVVDNLIEETVLPRVLAVEFDSPTSVRKMHRMIGRLRTAGLALVWFERENFLFVDQSLLEGVRGTACAR